MGQCHFKNEELQQQDSDWRLHGKQVSRSFTPRELINNFPFYSHVEIANKITSLEKNRRNVSKGFDRTRKDCFEDETLNENDEEEDRIFLRPGAVNSPLNNLNKRTSVEFNHNVIDTRNSKSRSMSLPVTYSDLDLENIFSSDQDSQSSCFQNVSSSNSSLLSPMRKTDFAFCKWKSFPPSLITFLSLSSSKKTLSLKFLLFKQF